MPSRVRFPVLVFLLAFSIVPPALAQVPAGATPPVVTAADYARAEKFLAAALTPLVVGGSVTAAWLPDDRFTYRNTTAAGVEFILVDPVKKTRARAFDHEKLAAALGAAAGGTYEPAKLPFQSIELSADGKMVSFDVETKRWSCDVQGTKCTSAGEARAPQATGGRGGRGGARTAAVPSPDGTRAVFIRNWNLWVRDVATGQERALTTDGEENFGYATDNAGWASSDRAIVLWSPDSKKVATFQQDERKVGEMYLVETKAGHPELRRWKYPLPGDAEVAMLHRVVIDAESGKVVRFQMPPDYHRAMLGDNFSVGDMKWNPEGTQLAFVSTSRDHKKATVRVADTATGVVRTVFEETASTHFESQGGWQVLWASSEIVWYSQRDDWGHLYLYDLATGALKNQITTGEGPVTQILRVDEKARTVYFAANGREAGQDPYFRHFYRTGLDGKNYAALTPDAGDHVMQLSPSGRFLVDTSSTCENPPVVVLRDAAGRLVMPLEKADISKLLAAGWKPPIPFSVKAHDGKTDIYGMLFRPTNFDPSKKYPIINNAYPGPQSGSVGSRSFTAARGDKQALAELGFVVVSIDGMGTPGRSKAFHDAYYGAMGRDNTLPDQVAGMKELAQRYPWIDIDRAAMWGHSGGGFIAADAMFRYPDFFKVGISESGNHDQRIYEDDWGERYQGLLVKGTDGTDNYAPEANQTVAKNLKGKLLLAHGLMDNNVPPYNTLLVVDALIKANKDFDLLLFPYQAHGFGVDSNYMMRRRWDYFVKWLLGAEPPKEYAMQPPQPPRFRP
ncbi:MAG: S9 family peptidase [Acidobacteria bacterium]|nr:MAG: S9 family peptidase [Acidobacteriota bacterium]